MEPTDRRPLVYGVFVLLIVVAASYLFWPRSPEPDSLVLTPESVRTQAAAAEMSGDIESNTDGELTTVDLGESDAPVEETSISDQPPVKRPVTTPVATTVETTQSTPDQASTTTRPKSPAFEPAGAGDWVINVGAFSKKSSAQTRAGEVSRQGMAAHVHQVSADGKALWRVRVGYFASKAKAHEYGEWMKSTHGIEGWAGSR
jgi:cell division septation protein DedD